MPIPTMYTPPSAQGPDPGQEFIKAFLQGLQQRRDEEDRRSQREERAEKLKHLKLLIKKQEAEEKHEERFGRPLRQLEDLVKAATMGATPTGSPPPDPGMMLGAGGGMMQPEVGPPSPLPEPPPQPPPMVPPVQFGGPGPGGFQMAVPTKEQLLANMVAEVAAKAKASKVPPTMVQTPPGAASIAGPEVPENALPGILSALIAQQPEPPVEMAGDIPGVAKRGEKLSKEELRARTSAYGERAATGRARLSAGTDRLDPKDPNVQATVRSLAERASAGQITPYQAIAVLGGRKGGLGPAFMRELDSLDAELYPAKVREQLASIKETHSVVDKVEELAEKVVSAKSGKERIANSKLLEDYINSQGTNLAKGYGGEAGGKVTDKDVDRVLAIFPGWKSANFAPDFMREKLGIIRDGLSRQERAKRSSYSRGGNSGAGATSPGAVTHRYNPATGKIEPVQ